MIIMVNEMKKEIVVWMKNLTSNIMMDQSSVIMKEQKSVEMMMMVIYKKKVWMNENKIWITVFSVQRLRRWLCLCPVKNNLI